MSKHTPGPWKHEVHETDHRGTGVIWAQRGDWEPGMYSSPNDKVVAQVAYHEGEHRPWRGTKGDEFEANARLIAAAPELLEALKAYADADECDVDGAPDANNSRHGETCRWCRAQAAIAKAEGE